MKTLKIFIISYFGFFLNLYANEHRVILHGHANHFNKEDRAGYEFNELNYGVGYEYNTYDGINNGDNFEVVYSFSANIIKDSYNYVFPFLGPSIELRTKGKYAVGLSLFTFVGYKKIITFQNFIGFDYTTNTSISTYSRYSEKYSIMGGITPGIKLYLGDFSLNYNVSPEFDGAGFHADGFHYFSLSYKL